MGKFQVLVDPDLEPIMGRYMELQFRDLNLMKNAIASGDGESVRMLGHKLKGSGASYGFNDLTEIGASMEIAGRTGDLKSAGDLAEQIHAYLENVEVIYGTGE